MFSSDLTRTSASIVVSRSRSRNVLKSRSNRFSTSVVTFNVASVMLHKKGGFRYRGQTRWCLFDIDTCKISCNVHFKVDQVEKTMLKRWSAVKRPDNWSAKNINCSMRSSALVSFSWTWAQIYWDDLPRYHYVGFFEQQIFPYLYFFLLLALDKV